MTTINLNELSAVIFDFDGLLVNSEEVIIEAWKDTCHHFSIDAPVGFFDHIRGISKDVTFEKLKPYFPKPISKDDFFEVRGQFIDASVEQGKVTLLPGVLDWILTLHTNHIAMYVATSSSKTWPERILARLNVRKYIRHIYGYEDVEKVKPYPDIYNLVVSENELNRDKTVVFEDSESGVIAATRAKLTCVIVNAEGRSFHNDIDESFIHSHLQSFEGLSFK